jgi:hypothetical protein
MKNGQKMFSKNIFWEKNCLPSDVQEKRTKAFASIVSYFLQSFDIPHWNKLSILNQSCLFFAREGLRGKVNFVKPGRPGIGNPVEPA